MKRRSPSTNPCRQRHALAGAGALLLISVLGGSQVGCYDGQELVDRIRSKAIRTRLEEVDLGTFRITLPQHEKTAELTEINVHMFAHTARYKTKALKRELEEKSHLVHDKAITTLRSLSHADLADPDLTKVRTKMLDGVNEILEEPVLSDVGLYDFHIARQ